MQVLKVKACKLVVYWSSRLKVKIFHCENNHLYYPVTAAFIMQSYIVLIALTDN